MIGWVRTALNRRSLLRIGALAGAGTALGAAARSPTAVVDAAPPLQGELCLADPNAPPNMHRMMTVGDVDHAPQRLRSAPDPHRLGTGERVARCRTGGGCASSRSSPIDQEIEIAPGVFFPAWTYNGRDPGPTLRANEGDLLRIHFTNAGTHPHTMHFHGIHQRAWTACRAPARSRPGEKFVYEFDGQAVRLPPLSLPLDAAEAPHPQGPLRRLHRRPRPGAPSRARGARARAPARHARERGAGRSS